jgi:hypothetical protein
MFCPKCGKEMACGYGLAGGGMGVYFYCETVGCETFEKFQDEEYPLTDERENKK